MNFFGNKSAKSLKICCIMKEDDPFFDSGSGA